MEKIIPMVVLCMACSSTVTNKSDSTDGGADFDAGGNSGASGNAGETAGGSSGELGAGGNAGNAGAAGTAGTAGTAGMNTAGVSGSGSAGTGPCIPKTCITIAVELNGGPDGNPEACGLVDNGCGNFIDCGGCTNYPASPYYECAGKNTENLCEWKFCIPPVENHEACENFPGTPIFIDTCGPEPPYNGCVSLGFPDIHWCCPDPQ